MSVGRMALLVLVLAVVGLAGSAGCSYNKFVMQEEAIKGQWGQVEVSLQRRSDLIPNLVETTKAFAKQEREVFQSVADARAKMAGATTPEQKIEAANAESSALSRLLVVVEAYPQLKSDANFQRLSDELANTENRIAVERGRYNQNITAYNQARRRFPANLTASLMGFKEYPYFEAPTESKAAPKVDFGK